MHLSSIKRAACGLAAVGTVGLVGMGLSSTAHAASSTPSVTASIALSGSSDVVSFTGSGFTSGGTVNIYVYDSNTGALLQTTPVQASAGTPGVTYVTQTQQICPPYTQQCQAETVNEPESTMVGGGAVSTNLVLPYTGDELVVEGVDATTSALSNQVALTAPTTAYVAPATTPSVPYVPYVAPATITSVPYASYGFTAVPPVITNNYNLAQLSAYGYNLAPINLDGYNLAQLSASGYTTIQSGSNVEVINPYTGAVVETLPVSSPLAYNGPQ